MVPFFKQRRGPPCTSAIELNIRQPVPWSSIPSPSVWSCTFTTRESWKPCTCFAAKCSLWFRVKPSCLGTYEKTGAFWRGSSTEQLREEVWHQENGHAAEVSKVWCSSLHGFKPRTPLRRLLSKVFMTREGVIAGSPFLTDYFFLTFTFLPTHTEIKWKLCSHLLSHKPFSVIHFLSQWIFKYFKEQGGQKHLSQG